MCLAFSKNKNMALGIASIIFALVAATHALRLFTHFSIIINGQEIPMVVSIIGLLITGFMSAWLWTLRHDAN